MTLIILRFIYINTFTHKLNKWQGCVDPGPNHFQQMEEFKVWTEPESAELWPPHQRTCCPLRRCFLYQNLNTKHKHLFLLVSQWYFTNNSFYMETLTPAEVWLLSTYWQHCKCQLTSQSCELVQRWNAPYLAQSRACTPEHSLIRIGKSGLDFFRLT